MSNIEVTLKFTRHMTFCVDTTDDPVAAMHRAEDLLMYDDGTPDDEDLPDLELERIKVGSHDVEFGKTIEFGAATDNIGLLPWKYMARRYDNGREISEGYDRDDVIRAAFAAVDAMEEA